MNIFLKTHIAIGIYILIHFFSCSTNNTDDLYENFKDPPSEAKPFVRWWWNGNKLTPGEIRREIRVMKEAGIGGFEINPIEMPGHGKDVGIESLRYLSPAWNDAIVTAIDEAHKQKLLVDLIIGSGWPFGGDFMDRQHTIQGIGLTIIDLEGPVIFETTIDSIMKKPGRARDRYENAFPPELFMLKLVPVDISHKGEIIDVKEQVNDNGRLKITVPTGEYKLYVGTWQQGFREVMHGTPGADGPVMDHFNKEAVQAYLTHFSDMLSKALQGELGEHIRSLFCDSIELSGANWSNNFTYYFFEKFGYRIEPYLPFVLYDPFEGYSGEIVNRADPQFADTIRRVRYDYNRALADMYLENFVETFHEWSNENGCQSRYQAYGMPWHIDISKGNMIPDIPESNNWLFSDPYYHGFHTWNKYASSGGHLAGKSVISSEAMTNTRGVFITTLDQIKRADDFNFICGINHSVLHGYNYSPPEAGFPGWIRFGSYFSEQNTWWPFFKLWSVYNARLSSVFQNSQAVSDVAILAPQADIWSNKGLVRGAFQLTPWYCHQLWKPINNLGSNSDYIHEDIIQQASFENGEMKFGQMKYKLIILCDTKSLYPETIDALNVFMKDGGKVVFIGDLPMRSPSLKNAEENNEKVRQGFEKLSANSRFIHVEAPIEGSPLWDWTKTILNKTGHIPNIEIAKPADSLYHIAYEKDNRKIYFFVNKSFTQEILTDVKFNNSNNLTPWVWEPETGERYIYPFRENEERIDLHLEPGESLLLVFDEKAGGKQWEKQLSGDSKVAKIEGPWKIEFQHHNGSIFNRNWDDLINLKSTEDSMLQTFAGTMVYQTSFKTGKNTNVTVDLGAVYDISELRINDSLVGTKWYGKHIYKVPEQFLLPENSLEIKVVTVLNNYTRSLGDNPTAQRWAGNHDLVNAGLVGPVRLEFELTDSP